LNIIKAQFDHYREGRRVVSHDKLVRIAKHLDLVSPTTACTSTLSPSTSPTSTVNTTSPASTASTSSASGLGDSSGPVAVAEKVMPTLASHQVTASNSKRQTNDSEALKIFSTHSMAMCIFSSSPMFQNLGLFDCLERLRKSNSRLSPLDPILKMGKAKFNEFLEAFGSNSRASNNKVLIDGELVPALQTSGGTGKSKKKIFSPKYFINIKTDLFLLRFHDFVKLFCLFVCSFVRSFVRLIYLFLCFSIFTDSNSFAEFIETQVALASSRNRQPILNVPSTATPRTPRSRSLSPSRNSPRARESSPSRIIPFVNPDILATPVPTVTLVPEVSHLNATPESMVSPTSTNSPFSPTNLFLTDVNDRENLVRTFSPMSSDSFSPGYGYFMQLHWNFVRFFLLLILWFVFTRRNSPTTSPYSSPQRHNRLLQTPQLPSTPIPQRFSDLADQINASASPPEVNQTPVQTPAKRYGTNVEKTPDLNLDGTVSASPTCTICFIRFAHHHHYYYYLFLFSFSFSFLFLFLFCFVLFCFVLFCLFICAWLGAFKMTDAVRNSRV
jgi:hypothetical protein